jgi:hypothetical protein
MGQTIFFLRAGDLCDTAPRSRPYHISPQNFCTEKFFVGCVFPSNKSEESVGNASLHIFSWFMGAN